MELSTYHTLWLHLSDKMSPQTTPYWPQTLAHVFDLCSMTPYFSLAH